MRYLTLFLVLACVQCGPIPAHAIELVEGKVVLTPREIEQMKSCREMGGCHVVTRAGLEAMVEKTIELTLIEAAKSCRKGEFI